MRLVHRSWYYLKPAWVILEFLELVSLVSNLRTCESLDSIMRVGTKSRHFIYTPFAPGPAAVKIIDLNLELM